MIKDSLRKVQKTIRDNIPDRDEKARIIRGRALDFLQKQQPQSVFCYMSFGSEVNTHSLILHMLSSGITVSIPKVIKNDMYAIQIDSLQDLKKNSFGIYEPQFNPEKIVNNIDVCFSPLLAFDSDKNRLGYGGGYYDKFFEKKQCKKVGLAFDGQKVECLPVCEHDIKLDTIITEENIY